MFHSIQSIDFHTDTFKNITFLLWCAQWVLFTMRTCKRWFYFQLLPIIIHAFTVFVLCSFISKHWNTIIIMFIIYIHVWVLYIYLPIILFMYWYVCITILIITAFKLMENPFWYNRFLLNEHISKNAEFCKLRNWCTMKY